MNPTPIKFRFRELSPLMALAAALVTVGAASGESAPPPSGMASMGEDRSTGASPSEEKGSDAPAMPGMKGSSPENPPAMEPGGMMGMSSSVDLLDPMAQEASGTAWLPSSTPRYGWMFMHNGDMLMLHGDIHPRYTDVGSKRGDRRLDAPNWFMGMYSHPLGSDAQLGLRAMVSLDPLTEGGFGYPLLFQTGETWRHQPLHDRQHPHDLFDELSATYSRRLGAKTSASLYLGYPGEPALGPPTYMHRLIAYDLADAPIGHHWQDSTHITFGVATAGLNFGSRVKVEGSVFTGREPNGNRYSFDPVRFDSHSGRISFNPTRDHSFQISYGSIRNPEGDGINQHRTTASWIYNKPLGEDANFTTSLVWGQNLLPDEGRTNSYLAEADYQRGRHTFFGRVENIQKSGHELVLPEADHTQKFDLGAYTVGYIHDLRHGSGIDTGVGAAVTVNTKPSSLDPFYGRGTPVSFQIFLRLRPSRMGGGQTMEGMEPATTSAPPTPEMSAPSSSGGSPEAGNVHLTTLISPDPPRARMKNQLMVRVTDANGQPLTKATVRAAVTMTSMDMGTTHPSFREKAGGNYAGDVVFSMAGPWQVALTITLPGAKTSLTQTVSFNVVNPGG